VSTLIRVDSTGNKSGGVSEMGGGSIADTGVAGMGGGSAAGAAVAGVGGSRAVGAAGVGGTVGVVVCLLTCGINNSSPLSSVVVAA
jgi:hypothetical protein